MRSPSDALSNLKHESLKILFFFNVVFLYCEFFTCDISLHAINEFTEYLRDTKQIVYFSFETEKSDTLPS